MKRYREKKQVKNNKNNKLFSLSPSALPLFLNDFYPFPIILGFEFNGKIKTKKVQKTFRKHTRKRNTYRL